MVKLSPTNASLLRCPFCQYDNAVPEEFVGRKLTCSYCDESFTLYRGDRAELLGAAHNYLQRAIALNPSDKEAYHILVDSYIDEECSDEALSWLDRAIMSDEQEDFNDNEFIFLKCVVYAYRGEFALARQVAEHLQGLIPPDDANALELVVRQFFDQGSLEGERCRFALAEFFLQAACVLQPDDGVILKLRQRAGNLAAAYQELDRLQKDLQITDLVKAIVRMDLSENAEEMLEPGELARLERILDTIQTTDRRNVRPFIKLLKAKYPHLYAISEGQLLFIVGEADYPDFKY